jgi:DNA-binding transcriptional regulator YhcF (GntR family)
MTGQPDHVSSKQFEVALDRDAEVPLGVQLAWALRARILDGRFRPGQRLPGLRELAEATAVNVNTIKAVYQRLDKEGLIDSQQGSGTFVTPARRSPSHVATIAANAAHEAQETGVDPREVAAALYMSQELSAQPGDEAARRRRALRKQIGVLERAIGELEAEHPGVAPSAAAAGGGGPALLSSAELEEVRSRLVHRLGVVQDAIDRSALGEAEESGAAEPRAAKAQKRAARPRPAPRAAPAGT